MTPPRATLNGLERAGALLPGFIHAVTNHLTALSGHAELLSLLPDLPPDAAPSLERIRQGTERVRDEIDAARARHAAASAGGVRFVINIDQHQECAGRFAAAAYTAVYRHAGTDALVRTETFLDRYAPVDSVFLPVERRYTEAGAARTFTRQLIFEDLELLPWDSDQACDAALF